MRRRITSPVALAWLAAAYLCLGIGLVGLALPLVPTTPFILLAAFAAARGSPRLHAWLLRHRVFGDVIRDWSASRTVARRAKVTALIAMLVAAAAMVWTAPPLLAGVGCAVIAVVATWLWLRPEPIRR
ncbi:MAG: YbaN family protein [Thermoleophilia bacterium]